MKKYILILLTSVVTLSSCSDWFDVTSGSEIREKDHYSTLAGFQQSLIGCYISMTDNTLYGKELSWYAIEILGHQFNPVTSNSSNSREMQEYEKFNYDHTQIFSDIENIWAKAYSVIANANEALTNMEGQESSLNEVYYHVIKGELLAIRAYMHFDLLRMYAPAPAANPNTRTFIPYVDKYPSYVNDKQTVSYCLEHAIADLKESQRILFDIDTESTNFNPDRRFVQKVAGEGAFAALRGYRLNYYAVTAILARVYLYAGMNDEAYAEAKKLIDEEEKTKYFAADESYYASDNFKNGNMKMYDNIIFALYSPTELVDWDSEINHLTDGKSESDQNYLSWSSKMLDAVYGIEKENDFRFKYQLELKYYGYNYRTLKYYKQVESTEYGKANNQIIPMIRMSEVYYIAAEAIYTEGDLLKIAEAKSYLEKVKKGRGIKTVDYSSVSSKNDFVNMIVNDARREFFGEGQTLYMFKRLNKVLTCDSGEIPMTEEYVVLPLPDSESNIK